MASLAAFTPIRHLGEMVRTKQVSPVELTEFALRRLERLGSKYNAVVTITREKALAQARAAEKEIVRGKYRGVLHGIPYGAKDLLATSGGIRTTWGTAPYRDQVFDYDATVVKKLEAAGAVLAAKLAMVELAGGAGYRHPNASFTGPGISPWNLEGWSGGSSSGSGSAVSAGLVPFALGTETWGSIMWPANHCGVAGLRPTFGRVSRHGAMEASWTMDKIGPFASTADDCGLVLEAIAGNDPDDETTTAPPFKYDARDRRKRRFKLALLQGSTEGVEPAVKANVEAVLALLERERAATVEEVAVPDMPYEAVARTIISAESADAYQEFTDAGLGPQLTAESSRRGLYARYAIPASDYIRAMRIRRLMCRQVDAILAKYDAVVGPSYQTVAPTIDREFNYAFSGKARDIIGALGNLAGLPSISVPNGFGDRRLPTGIQFMGRAYDENRILAVARAYQGLTDWHLRHPPGTTPDA
ncbi:MAG: amidase [SAR202 cluster bacterium]|nr:amidase [SAR202 cluster bacterium]